MNRLSHPHNGTRETSEYLRRMKVPRDKRIEYLEYFEAGTIQFQRAKDGSFDPTINRENLALPPNWNEITNFRQFPIKPGTPILRGKAAAQF
ncbi:hypothetical protein [Photobacterium aquae]|uniref:hypothetical protein n=1 Tax=Photobacterium aquae TaxID=1195763 RepID=UPI00147041A4|nr:hypothetical protein [Photobacterium aquae]